MTLPSDPPPGLPHVRRANPRWVKQSAGLVAIVSAAVIAFALFRGRAVEGVSGSLRATARTSIPLGHRGVAVAEPGAQLRWSVSGGGAARVEQSSGSVFYRVDRGGAFAVHTPAAEVSVRGTCFTVEVGPATASVIVHEGRVLVSNDGGGAEVGPGQVASATARSAPEVSDVSSPARSTMIR